MDSYSYEYDAEFSIYNGLPKQHDVNADKKKRNYKLTVDPALRQGPQKVYRFDGHIPGEHAPLIVRDPRSRLSRFGKRPEAANLPLPPFTFDEYYVGTILPKEVTFTNLNDNINQNFLLDMVKGFGPVEECKIYYHPKTKKHLGIAKVLFSSTKAARICAEKLHQTSKMGNTMNVFVDSMGKERNILLEDMTGGDKTKLPVGFDGNLRPSPSMGNLNNFPGFMNASHSTDVMFSGVSFPGAPMYPTLQLQQGVLPPLPSSNYDGYNITESQLFDQYDAINGSIGMVPPSGTSNKNITAQFSPDAPTQRQHKRHEGSGRHDSHRQRTSSTDSDYHVNDKSRHSHSHGDSNRHLSDRNKYPDKHSDRHGSGHRHRDVDRRRNYDDSGNHSDKRTKDSPLARESRHQFTDKNDGLISRVEEAPVPPEPAPLPPPQPPEPLPPLPSEDDRPQSLESRIALFMQQTGLGVDVNEPPPPLPNEAPPPLPCDPPPLPPDSLLPPPPIDWNVGQPTWPMEQQGWPTASVPPANIAPWQNVLNSSGGWQTQTPADEEDRMSLASTTSSADDKLEVVGPPLPLPLPSRPVPLLDMRTAPPTVPSLLPPPPIPPWILPFMSHPPPGFSEHNATGTSFTHGSVRNVVTPTNNNNSIKNRAERERIERQEDHRKKVLDRVVDSIIEELKNIMRRDVNKKMVENAAFKKFECWWDHEEGEKKNKKPLLPDVLEPVPLTASVSVPVSTAAAPAKIEVLPSTIAALFENKEGGSCGLGGIMGLRGLPKLPSFRRKFHPPTPPPEEEERDEDSNDVDFRGPRTPDDSGAEEEESQHDKSNEGSESSEDSEIELLPRSRQRSRVNLYSDSDEEEEKSEEEDEADEDEDDKSVGGDSEATVEGDEQMEEQSKKLESDEEEEEEDRRVRKRLPKKLMKSRKLLELESQSEEDLPVTDSENVEKDVVETPEDKDVIATPDNDLKDVNQDMESISAEKSPLPELSDIKNNKDIKIETIDTLPEENKKVIEKKGRGRKKKEERAQILDETRENLGNEILDADMPNGMIVDLDEKQKAETAALALLQMGTDKILKKKETENECIEHNYFAPTAERRQLSRQESRLMLAEATDVYVSEDTDSCPEVEEREAMMPSLPAEIARDHAYCTRLRPSSGEIPTSAPDLSHLWYDIPSPGREDDIEYSVPISVDTKMDVSLGEQVNIVATDELDDDDYEEEEIVVKKKRGRPSASDKFSRELASLLPQPKAKRKFPERTFEEETEILQSIIRNGMDEEDIWLMQKCYDTLVKQQAGNTQLMWLTDINWVEHPPTAVNDQEPVRKKRKVGTEEVRDKHVTGSARTEGYYKISHKEKITYMKHTRGLLETYAADSESLAAEMERGKKQIQKVQQQSREARAESRRWQTVVSSLGDIGDLLKFNQLKVRKKQLKFAKSRIHDWGLFALEPIAAEEMIVEYVGDIVRQPVADMREKKYEAVGIGSSYLFRIDQDTIIDATKCGNFSRFINHCCDPNCYAKIISVENQKKIVIYSKRNINVNEEITYDYKFPIEDEKIPCLCGASGCRGTLN